MIGQRINIKTDIIPVPKRIPNPKHAFTPVIVGSIVNSG